MIVRQIRGGVVEAEHEVAAVLVDGDGRVVERIGAPLVTTWRSAAKPFQLEVSLDLLADVPFDDRDLAVGASSHTAEDVHVAQVRQVLARVGCSEADLFCGADWPGDTGARRALVRAGREPEPIHNNCSGKHSFMAGSCRRCGWDRDYREPSHPLQERIRARLHDRTGGVHGAVVDGCGVPCWVLPLVGMGRAWAQLAREVNRDTGSSLARIGAAMHSEPHVATGTGRLDGVTMASSPVRVVAKIGAEGLICVALVEREQAVVVKVRSGDDTARAVALHAALDRWAPGVLAADVVRSSMEVRNCVGRLVGERVAV